MSEGKQLLERLLSSAPKTELLTLFHKNPGLVDTPEGVARRIGRSAEEIESAVDDFVALGILHEGRVGKLEVLRYERRRDKEVQASIETYFKSKIK